MAVLDINNVCGFVASNPRVNKGVRKGRRCHPLLKLFSKFCATKLRLSVAVHSSFAEILKGELRRFHVF